MSSACSIASPIEWNSTLTSPPELCSAAGGEWRGALVRRWRGTAPTMEQPPLDHHYLVLHLGGAKKITRYGSASVTEADAEAGAVTLAAAGTSYSWATKGPIGFAHLYLHPQAIDRVAKEEFDRDPRSIELVECVGRQLPLVSAMMAGMLGQLEKPSFSSKLVLDTLLHGVIVQLVSTCSTLCEASSLAPHTISPTRLRRVLEFIDANLAADLELEDLASVAGSSRFHFSRAFRDATGFPPYRYLIHRRIDAAKTLLLQDVIPIAQIAEQCGFNSQSQFSAMFRQVFGTSPGRFRREH